MKRLYTPLFMYEKQSHCRVRDRIVFGFTTTCAIDSYHRLCCEFKGRIQDFKLGGVHLKKLRRAEGGAKFVGVFRVKNHDFTQKNHIFSNFRGGGGRRVRPPPPPPPLDPPLSSNPAQGKLYNIM